MNSAPLLLFILINLRVAVRRRVAVLGEKHETMNDVKASPRPSPSPTSARRLGRCAGV